MSTHEALSQKVSAAFADRTKLKEPEYAAAVRETLALLDKGGSAWPRRAPRAGASTPG